MKIIATVEGKDYKVKCCYPKSRVIILRDGKGSEIVCNIQNIDRIMFYDWDVERD